MSNPNASTNLGTWLLRNVTVYGDLINGMMIGSLAAEARDYRAHFEKLLGQRDFKTFCQQLRPEYFNALTRIYRNNEPWDVITRELFGREGIDFNQRDVPTPESAISSLSRLYTSYLSTVLSEEEPFSIDATKYRNTLKTITSIDEKRQYSMAPALRDIKESIKSQSQLIFKTKYPSFNVLFGGGLREKRLYTIGAASGVGKSMMLLNLFADACQNDVKSLYLTLENSAEETDNRLFSMIAGIDCARLSSETIGIDEELDHALSNPKIAAAVQKSQEFGTVLDATQFELSDIRDHIIEHRPKILFLDYIGLVNHVIFRDRSKDLEDLTMALARLTKEFSMCIVTACQLNRGAISVDEPDEQFVGESYGIVKASDMFITIFPFKGKADGLDSPFSSVDEPNRDSEQMIFLVAKSRFSRVGSFPIIATKKVSRIREYGK